MLVAGQYFYMLTLLFIIFKKYKNFERKGQRELELKF